MNVFRQHNIKYVCDAACGFGKYSAILSNHGFGVSGFDISEDSVELTKNMLNELKLEFVHFCACSITDIHFPSNCFDGVVAHAVIDHLSSNDARKALNELLRITRKNGLIYLSFDGMEDDDMTVEHVTLEDGSFKYTDA